MRVDLPRCLLLVATQLTLAFALASCEGGGGGGGGGASPPPEPPFISAELDSFPPGFAPAGFTTNAFVTVLDDSTGASITTATVKMNGVALAYDADNEDYEGTVAVAPGAAVTVSVTDGSGTHTVSAVQFTTYPAISTPAPGDTWTSGVYNSVTWSGGSPTTGATYALGVLDASDPNAPAVWPLDHFFRDFQIGTTSFSIPAGNVTAGNRLVAVGISNTVDISSAAPFSTLTVSGFNFIPITVTGLPVTSRDSGTPNGLNGITWSGTQFVAVGDAGTILTSPDGITWTSRTSGTAGTLLGVAWSGTKFVAAGRAPGLLTGVALTSSDGITWTVQDLSSISVSTTPPWSLRSVVWSGTQFVAVGGAGNLFPAEEIATSPDGVMWTQRSFISSTHSDLRNIAWSGSQFVAVGGSGEILTSPDGITWTAQSSGTASGLDSVVWSGTQFVVGGDGGTVLTSPDGMTWTSRPSATGNSLSAITWTGTQFVAVGPSGTLVNSPDGLTWSLQAPGTSEFLNGIASGTTTVLVGTNGTIVTSP